MRVIRPAALAANEHRRALLLALSMLASGVLAAELVLLETGATVAAVGVLAVVAALGLGEGVGRWAVEAGMPHVPVRGAVAFPLKRSRVVLEEPEDEIVTSDNGPWWGNAIGRARRLDEQTGAGFLAAVLDAAESPAQAPSAMAAARH